MGTFQSALITLGDRRGFDRKFHPRQRRPFHQFHHQIILPDVVEMADIGMVERRDGSRFLAEAVAELFGSDFDGYLAADARIAGAIDFSHPAFAEFGSNLVRSYARSGRQRHSNNLDSRFAEWSQYTTEAAAIMVQSGASSLEHHPSGQPTLAANRLLGSMWIHLRAARRPLRKVLRDYSLLHIN